ncbi:MAG TPA: DNA-directed RNA polymerase subunit beta' [Dehalococcoidia bacterium]|nr:DNA-directed RNA polymerase subunit beta' [Chloroflexota bacterium]HCE76365.1 DNA-directed RNA polymerase subunit beta' [Dehalococcoidia bacterium]|tara:strand:- start:55 stop:4101 length:4047 start_codon:yes stop_codon:yes gene_type:complete
MAQPGNDFDAISISLASPNDVQRWSWGEVTKPETINYRTLRPEKDGLFCERIFGPTKDWECYCGKYKKIRFRGVTCDRCGVEVARSKVRRERMGHIELAAPVAHIWFSKGTPSRLGLLLDLSPRNLDRVLYFAQYLVTDVDQELKGQLLEQLHSNLEEKTLEKESKIQTDENSLTEEYEKQIESLKAPIADEEEAPTDESVETLAKIEELEKERDQKIAEIVNDINEEFEEILNNIEGQISSLEEIEVTRLLTETQYRDNRDNFPGVFQAGMGAESVLYVLQNHIDLDEVRDELQEEMQSTSGQRRKKAIKRLRVVESFRKSTNKPEWMILTNLPVLPPDLRPMVQLDGGRFATSDLNDLYRRVINRNNRLSRLIELQAPEIIIRNEKRMLQESVDALIDNGRRGRAVAGSHNHKLKSLSDLLRGKQGRFRQNLLGKRVDYSGRSVIIAGPELKLHQCGLPRRMALELFKPFVMHRLVLKGYAHNIRSAKRLAERNRSEVWEILGDVVKERPVLLNRAPTLHRLGIQAFEPVLIEGSAIRVHPLVCTAFNADFDGDQMAVHVPLSRIAVLEARKLMLSTFNMLAPSSGEPIVTPSLDMVLGCYYMTSIDENAHGIGKRFSNFDDAILAHEVGAIDLRAPIHARNGSGDLIDTTVGRILFNGVLPENLPYVNEEVERNKLKEITGHCFRLLGNEEAAVVLDDIKNLGFKNSSKSGVSIAINDVKVSTKKSGIVSEAEVAVSQLEEQYMDGLITEDERYNATVRIWTDANDKLTQVIAEDLPNYGGIYMMANSGAKGNIAQIRQMAGMRGLMSNPRGRIIDRPIKSNFREGLTVLEYFISTHGARKGLADTALRTADSGYLTRRLIDVAQEVIITIEDCGVSNGVTVEDYQDDTLKDLFYDRIKYRYTANPIANPETGEVIIDANQPLREDDIEVLRDAEITVVEVRSPLSCQAEKGLCKMCYGLSLANLQPIMIGDAVGIIAAQSIGEPGTQLTMRTFHTGGVAGADITSGLPRVEELFEARSPRGAAVLSEISGKAEIIETPEGRTARIINSEELIDEYTLEGYKALVKNGTTVIIGTPIAESKDSNDDSMIHARNSGTVGIDGNIITITWTDEEQREYSIPAASHIEINAGDEVEAGDAITAGPKNPQQILEIQGREAVQSYLIEEVQKVYRSQGVPIHDKHIETIIRQMLRRVQINEAGDTEFLPGDPMDRKEFEEKNGEVIAEGGDPATAVPILLGITRASLHMDSFLAAASFQETTRVLTESAVTGRRDVLSGLKENVIIGRLIPARYDITEEGREKLGVAELDKMFDMEGLPESPPPPALEDGSEISILDTDISTMEEPQELL